MADHRALRSLSSKLLSGINAGALLLVIALCSAPGALAAASGGIVVAPAKVRSQSFLLHLVRRARPGSAAAVQPGAVAFTDRAGLQRAFPIWNVGYLKSSDYDQAVGRLYSVLPDGQSIAECTATVVAVNVVLTAAHCVHDLSSNRDD